MDGIGSGKTEKAVRWQQYGSNCGGKNLSRRQQQRQNSSNVVGKTEDTASGGGANLAWQQRKWQDGSNISSQTHAQAYKNKGE